VCIHAPPREYRTPPTKLKKGLLVCIRALPLWPLHDIVINHIVWYILQ